MQFAVNVRKFAGSIDINRLNQEDLRQLIRSSGSVGANFREAIESVSKKDFLFRIKLCLKEARESRYWLQLIGKSNNINELELLANLIQETTELILIFSSIARKYNKGQ